MTTKMQMLDVIGDSPQFVQLIKNNDLDTAEERREALEVIETLLGGYDPDDDIFPPSPDIEALWRIRDAINRLV